MTGEQKKALLGLARRVVQQAIRGERITEFESEDAIFRERRGCFVTLHNGSELRGCIGRFSADGPLPATVQEMAIAATQDSRFRANPITPSELSQIDVELSVLSPLEKTDNPLSLELGVHGIYIKQGWASGCFLPQVALETGWSKEEFLGYCCCHKAGLPRDAWKSPGTEVYLFTADVFGEKDFKLVAGQE
jgi:uncharacterized protein